MNKSQLGDCKNVLVQQSSKTRKCACIKAESALIFGSNSQAKADTKSTFNISKANKSEL